MKLVLEYIINCTDCVTPLGRVRLPDGQPYMGDQHYGFTCDACASKRRPAEMQPPIEAEFKPGLWDRIVTFFGGK